MTPDRLRWTDSRLDDFQRRVDREFDDLTHTLRVYSSVIPQVATIEEKVTDLRRDLDAERGAHDAAIADVRKDARDALSAAVKGRKDTVIAMLGFAAPVTAAIIGGVIALIVKGSP